MPTPPQPPPSPSTLSRFLTSQSAVYGPLPAPLTAQTAHSWSPPASPGAGGHRGRYLWTDAFGLLNFITLSHTTPERSEREGYLALARRLAESVHEVLGRTRDGKDRLPGASEEEPLAGGLRIGKVEEGGGDGDGMYHHYATLWMFALERLGRATGEGRWVGLACQLGRASSRSFVRRRGEAGRGGMVWKVGVDGRTVLVGSEGHLDAATGFVVYRLVQRAAGELGVGEDGGVLEGEIGEYRELIMGREGRLAASRDALDLGMGLWMAHFFRGEEWARRLGEESLGRVPGVLRAAMARGAERRLAFREFGTCLGVRCWDPGDEEIEGVVKEVLGFWEKHMDASTDEDLRPISYVMYAAALIPGGG
ncbi:hypothetical protein CONLIGDRAFT_568514 [Coniochaeta ligniaria NRRL 30616]|uniref:Uncharacterized protein n=1 Tax=Coniochaeta ligniaria NRRL 30616 TaxID=1408157 RepID=A0A1J7K128_9PEZI|nr:hypothetical protein CONLIGDRAFT_568514 [Coniochaeta ligniaria NRRL 30616]